MAPRRRYSPEEIERGLTTLVIAGNSFKASELLGVPDHTLRDWKSKHLERYEAIRTEQNPQVAQRIASEAESIAQRLADLEHQTIDRLEAEMPDLPARDLSGALRNITTSKALQMDKISGPLRERPAYVQQNNSIDTIVQAMARRLGFDATSTAEEVPNETPAIPLQAESGNLNAREPFAGDTASS